MRGPLNRLRSRYGKKTSALIVLGFVGACLLGGGAYAALGGPARQQSSGDIELQRGLVGWWKLDGNAKDATPYANNGTAASATPAVDRESVSGKADSFAGTTSSYISVSPLNNFPSTAITTSLWVKTSSTSVGLVSYAIGPGGSNQDNTWVLYDASDLTVYIGNTNTGSTGVNVNDGNWHHVAVTWRSSDGLVSIYKDGALATTRTLQVGYSIPSGGCVVFAQEQDSLCGGFQGVQALNGSIDDTRLYNRVLSAAEVKALDAQYDTGVQAGSGESGLVGWWKLDGNGKDSTPNANNATVTSANYVVDRKGRSNGAYNFVSSSTKIEIPYSPAFNPSAALTVGAWINLGSYGTGVQRIAANLDSGGYGLYITGSAAADVCGTSNLCFRVNISGTYRLISIPLSNLTGGVWYYIAGTYDGTNLRLYVNNALATSATFVGTITTNTSALCIGSAPSGASCTSNFLNNVNVDDVRIYKRALSLTEITNLYNSYDSQINLNAAPSNSVATGNINQGLVGYWPFNGNAKDATPYSNNGTVTGAALTTDRKGRANSAYSFSGSPDAIKVTNTAVHNPTTKVSVGAWFKAYTPGTAAAQRIVATYDAGTPAGYAFITTGATSGDPCGTSVVCFRAFIGGTGYAATTPSSSLTPGTWYYLTGTYDGSFVRLYVNGIQVGSASASGALTASTAALCFGTSPNGALCNGNFVNGGSVDEVRIYNRALSATEVQMLYNSNN